MNGDRMTEFRPGKGFNFQDVVEEFHQLIGVLTNVLHIIRLLQSIEVAAHFFYAASGRSDDTIKILKVIDEETFGRLSIPFIAAIGHRLSATGLVEG